MRRFVTLLALTLGMLTAVSLPASASADVDDFNYSSWDSRYEISLDSEGRAVAHVTETVVAEFPDFDQNKGIVRGYSERYEGSGLDLRIISVKDADGKSVPFDTESDDGMLYVLTGTDDYVRGQQTYAIEYEMRDLMIYGTKTKSDEFYWNLLPLQSTQSIDRFHAEIAFSADLTTELTGNAACYQGVAGSTDRCDLVGPTPSDGTSVFTVDANDLAAGEGITTAIGFTPHTVTQPAARQPDPLLDWSAPALGIGSVLAAVGSFFGAAALRRSRRKGTGVVVAQFDVPADMPPLVATTLLPKKPNPIPAQIVHLAVNGALRLEDDAKRKRPAVRVVDTAAVRHNLDNSTMQALFNGAETRTIPRSSEKFAKRMGKLIKSGKREADKRGWFTKQRSGLAMALGIVSILLFVGVVIFLIAVASQDRDALGIAAVALMLSLIATIGGSIPAFMKHEVLTPAGAEQYEYLQGVHEFIRVAEADRLRMLQSYSGADRRSDGSVDVVHLYEKLLPYAMLFGEERSWSEVLETQYAESSPGWIDTAGAFGIYSHVSRFSSRTASASTYSAPSSSSSGGSSGGGFSGGGGGGGFSGGR